MVVETSSQQYLLYIHEDFPNHLNRAVHGSLVLYEKVTIPQMKFSKKQFVQIKRVEYPKTIPDQYGIIVRENNAYLFVPMDPRYPKMYLLEMSEEVYSKVRLNETSKTYSLLFESQLKPEFLNKNFFKV